MFMIRFSVSGRQFTSAPREKGDAKWSNRSVVSCSPERRGRHTHRRITMPRKLTLCDLPRTDDAPALGVGPVHRWRVDGLPLGERADITECDGTWRILRMRAGTLENDPREFPAAEAAFAVLVEEYADRKW
jgi:hypothetical protein